MGIKDIAQTIDYHEIRKNDAENERCANIMLYILGRVENESLNTALTILINSLEYLIRQLPEQDENDARMKLVEVIDKKSYTRRKISELNSREDDDTSSSGDPDGIQN